ncbi:MAG: hypothetical protein ACRDTG_24290 [Pseudonocardiaceae bacterium]
MSRQSTTTATGGSVSRSRPSPVRRQPGTTTPSGDHDRSTTGGGFGGLIRRAPRSPAVLLVVAMAVLAVLVNRERLGLDLVGGRILPVQELADIWSSYLAAWHPVGGGSAAPAPAALAVLGVLGLPVGSPAAAVSLLLLAAMPLAALSAYLATRALPVTRSRRALAAAAYAVLPPAMAGVAQGRLDVVLTFILLPLVLAGTAVVLRGGTAGRSTAWLSTAAATALGLAIISAFAPLVHLLILAVVLVGFVMVPASNGANGPAPKGTSPRGTSLRRVAGLFAVVLAPLGMLMPWPAVVVQRPAVLLHGVGAVVPESSPGWLRLLTLDPGGPGTAQWVGLILVAAAVVAIVARPTWKMLPGLGLVLLGAGAAAVLTMLPVGPLAGGDPRPGFAGGALLLVGCGLLWIVLLAGRTPKQELDPSTEDASTEDASIKRGVGIGGKAIPVLAGAGVGALAVAAVLVGAAGPLTAGMPAGQPVLAAALTDELARGGTSVLVVGAEGEPVRLTRGRTASFGDDDVAPLRATGSRLERVAAALRAGKPGETAAAIANVAATGVEFVVLPTAEQGARALAAAGQLAESAPPTADGRPVLRVVRPIPGVELLGPALAEQARGGASPPIDKEFTGVLVEGRPPSLAVRVEPGAEGRLLVIAANDEPGWRASVDGATVPVVRSWGHQVAVQVPATAAEVRVDRPELARALLLLGQVAIVLLIAGMAVPAWRRRER